MTSKLTKKQKETFRLVARRLRRLRHEEHYDQNTFGDKTECGTVCCIAGHAAIATLAYTPRGLVHEMEKKGSEPIIRAVSRALGLCYRKFSLHWLFCPRGERWPEPYQTRFDDARSNWFAKVKGERPSRVAADLLDAIADGKVNPRTMR